MSAVQRCGLLWDCTCAVYLCAARATWLRSPNFDLLALQRRGPGGYRCGWACRDAAVSIQIRFCASSSDPSLCIEKTSRACRRRRSYA
ncbi:uncharacterized protein TRAVEDRAFT_31577 [Trametes versicolor FP-101664 SS1]|uniref:uncharacterized protein n=1 Tax=Trametes versicolor (strain FP-101664) TaxID=717944 RepID=UPI000462456C|nr:uncharacterized protein TRAVEDRAFT_31577 [Trametes versicolor FP-101664 SS1]EIW53396.1 hypothetical protein TRAVEDRAFT_31577 [Trametes versicolor FP-101664 SS1]